MWSVLMEDVRGFWSSQHESWRSLWQQHEIENRGWTLLSATCSLLPAVKQVKWIIQCLNERRDSRANFCSYEQLQCHWKQPIKLCHQLYFPIIVFIDKAVISLVSASSWLSVGRRTLLDKLDVTRSRGRTCSLEISGSCRYSSMELVKWAELHKVNITSLQLKGLKSYNTLTVTAACVPAASPAACFISREGSQVPAQPQTWEASGLFFCICHSLPLMSWLLCVFYSSTVWTVVDVVHWWSAVHPTRPTKGGA